MVDPQTPEQWQEAVDGAEVLLMLDACRQYGLVKGGPGVNAERCEEILERGRERGIRPNEDGVKKFLEGLTSVGRT